MREDICTIPVSEVFEVTDGCPLCRMHQTVEEHILDYIMGDAMMESDVRIATNEQGFCPDHYEKMLSHEGRLQLSLMLSTHLKEINEGILKKKLSPEKAAKAAGEVLDGCFICDKIAWGEKRMIATVYRQYENDEDFRKLFDAQPYFCFKHYAVLMGGISKKTCRKYGEKMAQKLTAATKDYCEELIRLSGEYSMMYDYRSAGKKDFGECRLSVEKSIDFLTAGEKGGLRKSTK